MKKFLLLVGFISSICYAQEKIPFVDYKQIIEQIREETDNKKIIDLFNKINENDSAYYASLTSKTYYLLQIKDYLKVLETADKGIQAVNNESKSIFYINKGVALIKLGKKQEAMQTYEEGITFYPKNSLLWYNMGYLLELEGKINQATKAYKKAITLNPSYTKPHIQLGNIYYKQERISQALMCFNMYLLLEPDATGAFNTLKSLNNTAQAKNINEKNDAVFLEDADNSYEEIDLILDSKLAINKEYKIDNPIDIALTRQNHALITQLEDFEGESNFWTQTYLPMYKWLAKNNKFDDFIYTLTYSIENEKFKKIIDKKTDDIISFLSEFKQEWFKKTARTKCNIDGKLQDVVYEYSDGTFVSSEGNFKNSLPVGVFRFFNKSGGLSAKGNFNLEGKRDGKWSWFFNNGKVKETAFYKDGILEGVNHNYFANGKKFINASFKNDTLDGKYEYFNKRGALEHRKYFEKGKLEGVYKSYFSTGENLLEFDIPYKQDKLQGEVLEYFENGNIYAKTNYDNGKKIGVETTYYINKQISTQTEFKNGFIDGTYKSYHKNGKNKEVGQSLEGEYEGNWKSYYANGVLECDYFFSKGKLDGLYTYYNTDGNLYYEFLYRKGELIAYKYFNKDGSILKEAKKKGGEFYYEGFTPKGIKVTEGLYDISGGKTGEWKFYNDYGVLDEKGNFIENEAFGKYFNYYRNGDIENITPYENGKLEGYYVAYHLNKKMKTQGWYKDNEQHGEWRFYDLDGNLEAINYFHNGDLNGEQKNFGLDGKLASTTFYDFGDLISENHFTKSERLFQKINLTSNNEEYSRTYKHYNGKTKYKISFVNQVKHGSYNSFYFNGNKEIVGTYVNGKLNGKWKWFYEDGTLESKRNYLNGNTEGKVTNYYKNGKIEAEYYYDNDLREGTQKAYYDTGAVKSVSEYKEGKRNGKRTIFEPSGKLQLIRFYDKGQIIGYSYLNKKGDVLTKIPIEKGSGKIEAFFDNGQPSVIAEYKNGYLENSYKLFYYNGKPESESNFLNGEIHGVSKEYFLNGNIKEETNYKFGNIHGKKTLFYQNGKKKEEVPYLNDSKHGIAIYYDKSGKPVMKKEFFNDNVYEMEKL